MANLIDGQTAASFAVNPAIGQLGLLNKVVGGGYQYNPAGVDPRLEKLQQQQASQAQDFRKNLGSYQEDQARQAAGQARQDLAAKMSQIKTGMNQRGLLYSGLSEGAKEGAAAQSGANLAAQRANINTQSLDAANKMEGGAIQSGLALQKAKDEANAYNYNQAMAQNKQKNAVLGAVMGAGGGLLGGALG